jgi:hypothetical protein
VSSRDVLILSAVSMALALFSGARVVIFIVGLIVGATIGLVFVTGKRGGRR